MSAVTRHLCLAQALALASSLILGCGPMRSSMIGLDSMRESRGAAFAATGDVIVVSRNDPMGGAMVLNHAYLDGDRVVLGALVTSSGGAAARVECVDVRALSRAPGWEERIYWRGPDGALARVSDVVTGAEAAALASACPAR